MRTQTVGYSSRMSERQGLSRRQARERRASVERDALHKVNANCELAANALKRAGSVVADPGFLKILLQSGLQSIPKFLDVDPVGSIDQSGKNQNFTNEHLDRISLEFAVAWKFLHPFLYNTQAKAYLETTWPGFISELKDAFIALVIDGPFPHAMSGHRGRKHHGNYFRT